MKKRILLITAVGAMAYVTLQSNSGGPTGNLTGSAGGAAGCYTCHGSTATTGITMGIELDSAGVPVTYYTPGNTYKIIITDTNTTAFTLPKYGFQFSAVKATGGQAGTFGTAPTGTLVSTASIKIWGHLTPLSPISGTGGTGTIYKDSINWTAPSAGSGTVKMYLVMNDVNNDGNDNASDKWNIKNVSISERVVTPPSSVATVASSANINAYPNPTSGNLSLKLTDAAYGNYNIAVYDLTGRQVATQTTTVSGANASVSLDASNWASGIYNAVVEKDGTREVVQVVKQ